MNIFSKTRFVIILTIISSICIFSQPALSLKNNSYTYIKSNLEFLSADELEGREAASRGEKIAALYISEELEKYGVLPYGDNGTYFQNFGVVTSSYSDESNVTLIIDGKEHNFVNGSDLVFSSRSLPSNKYNNKEYEIVFTGYGITSEDDNYDNYKNIDVSNKVVMFINGTPKVDGQEFLSKSVINRFGKSSTEKIKLARMKGAVGVIILPDEKIINYWDYITRWTNNESFKLEEEVDTTEIGKSIPAIILSENSSKLLLENEEQNFELLIKNSDPRPKSFLLKSKLRFDYNFQVKNKTARNIIGLIKGTNENFKDEYLTMGAHYDHEGIKNGEVYNGADDNGSGTVTLLEVARKLSISKENERPILVIFHTGEEKGLKGSKYLTNNSSFMDSVIVHVNIDMVGRKSEDSIYCIGASKISSELGQLIESVNLETTNFYLNYKFDDPNDHNRLYYRSDHINYAKKGIPIAFFYDYMKTDYHKPTDTVDKINFDKIVRMTDLIYNLFVKISNLDHKLSVDELSTN